MLENQSIYLTRMDRFDDKLEGISTFDITELLHSYKEYFQDDPSDYDGLTPHYKNLVKKGAKDRLNAVRKRLQDGQKQHYVSSWYNSERESDGMWRFYGRENGFALKVSRNALQEKVKESVDFNTINKTQSVRVGKIKYQDSPNVINDELNNSVLYLSFRKDIAFAHENEYRIVFIDSSRYEKDHVLYKLNNFCKLDITIICHPGMEHAAFIETKEELEAYGSNNRVKKSELEPFYQLFPGLSLIPLNRKN